MTRTPGPTPAAPRRREPALADVPHAHWQQTCRANPGLYGEQPSGPARYPARAFATSDATAFATAGTDADATADELLELGTGNARYGVGTGHGDDIRAHPFEEGELPRRLRRITQETPR
ncbi:hypothetical protein ACIRVF_13555 [Kitasatospora sp. NPDC101157]|uniref:hypothetical protein n=1 Tax=Kitasatospora sp. NPDC101157 TaxID=3364098 RepID=UPI0037F23B7E